MSQEKNEYYWYINDFFINDPDSIVERLSFAFAPESYNMNDLSGENLDGYFKTRKDAIETMKKYIKNMRRETNDKLRFLNRVEQKYLKIKT